MFLSTSAVAEVAAAEVVVAALVAVAVVCLSSVAPAAAVTGQPVVPAGLARIPTGKLLRKALSRVSLQRGTVPTTARSAPPARAQDTPRACQAWQLRPEAGQPRTPDTRSVNTRR